MLVNCTRLNFGNMPCRCLHASARCLSGANLQRRWSSSSRISGAVSDSRKRRGRWPLSGAARSRRGGGHQIGKWKRGARLWPLPDITLCWCAAGWANYGFSRHRPQYVGVGSVGCCASWLSWLHACEEQTGCDLEPRGAHAFSDHAVGKWRVSVWTNFKRWEGHALVDFLCCVIDFVLTCRGSFLLVKLKVALVVMYWNCKRSVYRIEVSACNLEPSCGSRLITCVHVDVVFEFVVTVSYGGYVTSHADEVAQMLGSFMSVLRSPRYGIWTECQLYVILVHLSDESKLSTMWLNLYVTVKVRTLDFCFVW